MQITCNLLPNTDITVITLTRGRPNLLLRAIKSVTEQDFTGSVTQLVIVDNCSLTEDILVQISPNLPPTLKWIATPKFLSSSGSERLACLRNWAVSISNSRWISFLDDDNEFENDHLNSLVNTSLKFGGYAVHSQMQIFTPDGSPYLECRYPWVRNIELGRQLYWQYVELGIFVPGSNIVKDRVDPYNNPNSIRSADTGEWLFERELLIKYPFPETYTAEDIASVITEDDKLLSLLVDNKIPVMCTNKPTLKYYLGGYSNNFCSE